MPYLDVTDVRLYFEDRGSGDPILLVHGGLGTGAFHWRRQIAALAERFRVIAPDLRGLGRSGRVDFGPDVFEREAADLIDLAGKLGLARLHVVGFSAGSMTARLIPVERPDLVQTLTLISGPDRLAGPVMDGVRRLLAEETRRPKFAKLLADLHGADDWEAICDARLAVEMRFAELTGGDATRGRLGEIRCPVLILRGERDHIIPRAATEGLAAAIPHAELRELAGGDHLLPLSSAAWLNPILIEWFDRHSIGRSEAAPPADPPGARVYCKSWISRTSSPG